MHRTVKVALVASALFTGLYLSHDYSFLLFHSLAEGFSIVVAASVFMLAWNSRRVIQNNYILFIGVAYLFVAALDLTHTLAYKGMGVFAGYDANLPTQLWIAGRYLQSLSLLAALLLLNARAKPDVLFFSFLAVTAALLWSIFAGYFPDCFIEGSGLTAFKKQSEYAVSLVLAGSIGLLYRHRTEFDPSVHRLLVASVLVTIASELSFTFYVSVYGLSNVVGHYLKFTAFYLMYKALIETGIGRPYEVLFRDLKRSEERYRSLFGNMLDGFASHKVVLDKAGAPVDYVFVEVNEAFSRLTGLETQGVIGRRVTEVLPGIERDPADWIGRYGRVALGDGAAEFENYSKNLAKWYSVTAYSPEREHFAVVFRDITVRKQLEENLKSKSDMLSAETLRLMEDNSELKGLLGEKQVLLEELNASALRLSESNAKLKKTLHDKQMLMREVHHRVKNNFISLYALLRFQSMRITDRESLGAFKESQDRVMAMSLIHDQLYKSDDFSGIGVSDYLRSLTKQLFNSYNIDARAIKLSLDIEEFEMDVDAAAPCGLIVNELIANALKYAFPDGRKGTIGVTFSIREDGLCELSVVDDGVGLPDDYVKSGSLGMELVGMLTVQLNAKAEISREGGTEFRMTFDPNMFSEAKRKRSLAG